MMSALYALDASVESLQRDLVAMKKEVERLAHRAGDALTLVELQRHQLKRAVMLVKKKAHEEETS